MAFKIYRSGNYFIINDTSTGEDILRQVRDNIRWEKKDDKYSFFLKSDLLQKNEDQFIKGSRDLKQLPFSDLYGPIDFTDAVDSDGLAWSSETALDTFLNKWTGYIHLETIGSDALYNLYNSVPTLLSTGTIPSGSTSDITAPDGTINIKKTGDGTISSQSVPSGATVNYNVADNAITVNSGSAFTIHATDSLDIVLKDTTGATVTPDSVTPHAGTHHVDIVLPANVPTYSSAKLMKTGQTTSYATGDDGDLEIGRGSSFFTLISNNPFGNTNRFTDELGGTTYANNIVIDWSTFDGTTVLGYKRTATFTASGSGGAGWTNAINGCAAISIGTFTSGWRLANLNEWNNVINIEYANPLGYAPFTSFVWTFSAHTSSTYKGAPSVYSWGVNNIGYNVAKDKNESSSCLAVRTFTVTGTTLT